MKSKLKSEKGASLIVALLFFVLCAVVGSIILTAATVASGRVKNMRRTAQAEYDLYSAAKYLQETLTEGSFTAQSRASGASPTDSAASVTSPEQIVTALATAVYTDPTYRFWDTIDLLASQAIVAFPDSSYLTVPVMTRKDSALPYSPEDPEGQMYQRSLHVPSWTDPEQENVIQSAVLSVQCQAPGEAVSGEVEAKFEMFENFDLRITLTQGSEDAQESGGGRALCLWLYASDIQVPVRNEGSGSEHVTIQPFSINWPNSEIKNAL